MAAEYLDFALVPGAPGRKTGVWRVLSRRHGVMLGAVLWYGPWRQYVFEPSPGTVWSDGCLEQVRQFIAARMQERRDGR